MSRTLKSAAAFCQTVAEVRERAAQVQAFRESVWPRQRPIAPAPSLSPAPKAAPAPARAALIAPLFIELGNCRCQIASLKHASEFYCAARDIFGDGASRTPEIAIVTADGRAVAHISDNGRVWPAEKKSGEKPLYDPSLVGLQPAAAPDRITVRRVLEATAQHFDLTVETLVSGSRKLPLPRQRQIAMYVAHAKTGRSFPFIGSKIGGRNHTTILHGVRAVKALIDAGDAETIAAVNRIVELLPGDANG
jgi:hypothetical protein